MRLLEFFREHNSEIIDFVQELVLRESPSHDKQAVNALGLFILEHLREAGAQVMTFPRSEVGDILYASWNDTAPGKPILLIGHIDTVWPVGTLKKMPIWQDGHRLYGPGILDMKAGVGIIIETIRLLKLHGGLPRRPIWALFTTDEEIGSAHSREMIEKVATNAGLALVFEPADRGETVKTSRRGMARYKVFVQGIPAHSGLEPEKGVNAIHEAAYQILRIAEWDAPEHGTNVATTLISGGTAPNVIAPDAEFLVDFRFSNKAEAERLETLINDLKPVQEQIRLSVKRVNGGRPPMERDAQMLCTFNQCARLAGQLGIPIAEELDGAGSDANFTAAMGIPTLDGLGARGIGMHAENEHIIISSIPRRAALLASMLQNWDMAWCNGKDAAPAPETPADSDAD